MISLYRRLVSLALADAGVSHRIVLYPRLDANESERAQGAYFLPDGLFPEEYALRPLPASPDFVDRIEGEIPMGEPAAVVLVPPVGLPRDLPPALRERYGARGVHYVALLRAVECLAPGSRLAVLLPRDFAEGRVAEGTREAVFEKSSRLAVIAHEHSVRPFGWDAHPAFRMDTLVLQVGRAADEIIRFFRVPRVDDEAGAEALIREFQTLLSRQGGATRNGYVHRDGLAPGAPLMFSLYSPEIRHLEQDLGHFGELRTLGDLVTLVPGVKRALNANRLVENDEGEGGSGDARGVPLVDGRDIGTDGRIGWEQVRYRVLATEDEHLRPGDLLVRRISERFVIARVEPDMPPMAASDSVVVLRPLPATGDSDHDFLFDYLRSETAARLFRARHTGVILAGHTLLSLPVPVPDDAVRVELRSLADAVRRFAGWRDEADRARTSLFAFDSTREARMHLLSVGRRVRQRTRAAELIDDFAFRARTRLPHPIAHRWRRVLSAGADIAGYFEVLECAEVAACYLATLAIAAVRPGQGATIQGVAEIARRLSGREKRGTTMGDWLNILTEINSRRFQAVAAASPFPEVFQFLGETDTADALRRLAERRNDQAHVRGPKDAEVPPAVQAAKGELETFLGGIEFLAEYPLRLVEVTRRDSLRQATWYSYRDLMGDHPLVPLEEQETAAYEVEAGSLYLVDRKLTLHLLRPLLSRQRCRCGQWATFHLEKYDPAEDVCVLKALEDGHTLEDRHASPAFRHVGLLGTV